MSGLGGFSILELFRLEVETQVEQLNAGLLALEKQASPAVFESLMRAAHSLKGAARMVGVHSAERVAHVLEDCLVAAQQGELVLNAGHVDRLLEGVDFMTRVSQLDDQAVADWESSCLPQLEALLERLREMLGSPPEMTSQIVVGPSIKPLASSVERAKDPTPVSEADGTTRERADSGGRTLRLGADRLDALLRLSGEAQVAAAWLGDYTSGLLRFKSRQVELVEKISELTEALRELDPGLLVESKLESAGRLAADCSSQMLDHIHALSAFDRRVSSLSGRLHSEVVASRMRPFSDLAQSFPRLARDLARTLGKEIQLEIKGQETLVDRDILERLETPLNHLVRNAADHGIEPLAVRLAAGKPSSGTIKLIAEHRGGMLWVGIEDDGAGLDYEALRRAVTDKGLSSAAMAARLTRDELEQFLFLPSFTSKQVPDEISGRGVGLDLVRSSIMDLGGQVHVESETGKGIRFGLVLPLTLSMVHCLLVQVQGEPYAFPLSRLESVTHVEPEDIGELEGRPFLRAAQAPLVWLSRALDLGGEQTSPDRLPVVLISHNRKRFGLAVDAFAGEQNLVVHRLDPRLGKVPSVASAAILDDGTPALILDVDDLARNVERLLETHMGRGDKMAGPRRGPAQTVAKRVLLVEDSITVREVERQLLEQMGFEVDVAVDGADGWNAARQRDYHLIITDIDMPRMDGFELVSLIKADPRLRATPVMIVSYKDRDEDRRRGLEVGADYFLTKGSFHDQTLMEAVRELTG